MITSIPPPNSTCNQEITSSPKSCVKESKETVAAVVVTYQRKDLLLECLSGLLSQSHLLNAIFLVDNASNDGTPELLKENDYIDQIPPEETSLWESRKKLPNTDCLFHYIRLPENTGGAGGFHEGVKRAYEAGYHWLWLMDDDVEPDKSCLSDLLIFQNISKCIHPRKQLPDGSLLQWEGYINPVTGCRVFQQDPSFKKGFQFSCTNTGCFEGMLIHRDIVREIGYPDPQFFIGSDDSVYGFLAHFHTPVLYAFTPRLFKKIFLPWFPISDRGLYYGMRNYFLRNRYLNQNIKQYRFIRAIFIGVRFMDYLTRILYLSKGNKKKHLIILFRAFWDGLRGRYGKRF